MEQHKVRTYTLYALGEILLVVIGILIALQVNNWNESRIERSEEKNYLNRLLNEVESDSSKLDGRIELASLKVDQAKYLLNYMDPQTAILDSSLFVRYAFLVGRGGNYMPYLPAYNELLSTGKIDIIQNEEIIADISGYIERVESLVSFLYDEGELRRSQHNNHIHHYFSALIMNRIWETDEEFTLSDYEEYLIDIEGFRKDANSAYHIRNLAALNAESEKLYIQLMEYYIQPVLLKLRKELDSRDN